MLTSKGAGFIIIGCMSTSVLLVALSYCLLACDELLVVARSRKLAMLELSCVRHFLSFGFTASDITVHSFFSPSPGESLLSLSLTMLYPTAWPSTPWKA